MSAPTSPIAAVLASILDQDSIVPAERVSEYAVDGVVPQAVVSPTSDEQVAAVLGVASKEGWTVAPRGAGSLLSVPPPARTYYYYY